MTLPNLIERITEGAVLITPGDRADVLLAAMFAHASTELPSPAGRRVDRWAAPAAADPRRARKASAACRRSSLTEHDTYETVVAGERARGRDHARRAAQDHQGAARCSRRTSTATTCSTGSTSPARAAVTPLMFEYTLLDRARVAAAAHRAARGHRRAGPARGRHPAAAARGRADAARPGGGGARHRGPARARSLRRARARSRPIRSCVERFANEYAARRAHKGVTVDAARDVVSATCPTSGR